MFKIGAMDTGHEFKMMFSVRHQEGHQDWKESSSNDWKI